MRNQCPFNVLIMNTSIKITDVVSLLQDENLILIRKKKQIESVRIEPQLTQILMELIQHKDQVITKQYLINRIWNGNVFVGGNALRKNIYKLRALIKDHDLKEELSIITIPKKGYKLTIQISHSTIFNPSRKWILYAAASVILLLVALRVFTEDNTDFTKDQKILVQEDVEEILYK